MKSTLLLAISFICIFVFCRDQKYFDQGMSYFNEGHYLLAFPSFEKYIKEKPNDWKGHYYLALCYMKGGCAVNEENSNAKFIASINKAIELKPFSESDYIAIVKDIIPKNATGYNIWYSSEGKLFVEKCLANCGNSKEALFLKAEYLGRQFQYKSKIEVLKSIGQNFSDATAYYRIGEYYYGLNSFDTAKTYITKALSLLKTGDTLSNAVKHLAESIDKAIIAKVKIASEVKLFVDNFFPEGGAFSRRSYHNNWESSFDMNNLFLWLQLNNPLPINLTECDISFIYKKTKDTIITLHYYFTTPNYGRCDTTCGSSRKPSWGKPVRGEHDGLKGGLVVDYDESNSSYQNLNKIFNYAAANKLYPYDLFDYVFKNISYQPIAGLELSYYYWCNTFKANIPKKYTVYSRIYVGKDGIERTYLHDTILWFNIVSCNTISEAEELYNLVQQFAANDSTLLKSFNKLEISFMNDKNHKLTAEKKPGSSFVKIDTDFQP